MARGHWQAGILADLLAGRVVASPRRTLRGAAYHRYLGDYEASFRHLLARMAAQGYHVMRCVGPNGGEYGASYKLLAR